jgi:tRNA1Val (adenine37-N6)-methyltransferase
MPQSYFQFKQFTVYQDQSAMKVTTDACLFGAWCAREIQQLNTTQRILDIGTGTGLLALMIAQKNNVRIDAVEIDCNTAEQASKNCLLSPFRDQITVFKKDISEFEKANYDCIVSNPPFYENEIKSERKIINIAHHSDGLIWDKLFEVINEKLSSAGIFFLLLPYKRKGDLKILLKREKFYITEMLFVKQTPTHDFFRMMIKCSKIESEIQQNEITIKGNNKEYTTEFIDLLRDYYLLL